MGTVDKSETKGGVLTLATSTENLLFTADAAAELHLCPSAAVSSLGGSTATFKTYNILFLLS